MPTIKLPKRCCATVKFNRSLLAAFALLAVVPLRAQQAEDIGTVPALLQEAETAYKGFKCDRAESVILRAKAALAATESGRPLRIEEEGYALRGNEILVECKFEAGKTVEVQSLLRENLTRKPTYALPSGSSPKLRRMLEEIRGKAVGIVSITSNASDAMVFLGGKEIGQAPLEAALPVGVAHLELKAKGYTSAQQDVSVTAGGKQSVNLRLTPTGRTVVVFTKQPDIEVYVDGELAGKTKVLPLAADVAGALKKEGADPATTAVAELAGLLPGPRLIAFYKPCLMTQPLKMDVTLDPEQNSKLYLFSPVEMTPSKGSLHLDSQPTGAAIFINGESKGLTPFADDALCSGEMDIRVEMAGRGRWLAKIMLANDGEINKLVPLRPTLRYLGLYQDGDIAPATAQDEFKLRQALRVLKSYNTVIPSAEELKNKYAPAVGLLGRVPAGTTPDPLLAEAAGDYELLGVYVPATAGADGGLKLYSPQAKSIDFIAGDPATLAAGLDRDELTPGVWLGAGLAEASGFDGLAVGAPAQIAPDLLQAGDRVTKIAGHSVNSVSDARKALSGHGPGEAVLIERQRGGLAGPVNIRLLPLYRHLPPDAAGLPAGKMALELGAASREADPLVAGMAKLNLAMLQWAAGKPADAAELLASVNFPARRGISAGTVSYLRGLLARKRGDTEAARKLFAAAAADEGATWLSDDGAAIAPLATAALKELAPPPPAAPARKK